MAFVFNGISSKDKDITARLTSWQALSALRNSFVFVPSRAGKIDFGGTAAEKIIMFKCNIFPQSDFSSLISVLDDVAKWLNPDNGLCELMLNDVPDRYFMSRLQEAVDCERLVRSSGAFDLNFICPDPFGYALADEVFTLSSTGIYSINRLKGNTASEPVYFLKGVISSSTSSYVSIITNDVELRIICELNVGEILIIDSSKVTAKIVNAQGVITKNGLPCLQELYFPVLQTGTNVISITTNSATFTELKIQAMSRWR